MLESTYISDLIREIRIKVRKKDTDGNLTFTELSEGEQQLLTVLGLLKFTNETESLFLLDEPDTHLNPAWKVEYLSLLEKVVGKQSNSHLIISTHDPLVISDLEKSQVQIFEEKSAHIVTHPPDEDPRGMGVEGLLKSELYGLRSTVGLETQRLMDEREKLFVNENRSPDQNIRLAALSAELSQMGFATTFRDPSYEAFAKALSRHVEFQKPILTKEEIVRQEELADEILNDILEKDDSHSHR